MPYLITCQDNIDSLLIFETTLGSFEISFNANNITKTGFSHLDIKDIAVDDLYSVNKYKATSDVDLINDSLPRFVKNLKKQVEKHLQGHLQDFDLSRIDKTNWSPFKKNIMDNLAKIAPGNVISYKELCAISNFPKAYRACGQVMATNEYALILPCHRVLKSNYKLGNYSGFGSSSTKLKLLNIEKFYF